jgi:hypothetical protein
MTVGVIAGTPGWAYRDWRGPLLPARFAAAALNGPPGSPRPPAASGAMPPARGLEPGPTGHEVTGNHRSFGSKGF